MRILIFIWCGFGSPKWSGSGSTTLLVLNHFTGFFAKYPPGTLLRVDHSSPLVQVFDNYCSPMVGGGEDEYSLDGDKVCRSALPLPHTCIWQRRRSFAAPFRLFIRKICEFFFAHFPVLRIRDVNPDPNFYPSRILNPKTATKVMGEKKFICHTFFVDTNFTILKIFCFWIAEGKYWANFKRII